MMNLNTNFKLYVPSNPNKNLTYLLRTLKIFLNCYCKVLQKLILFLNNIEIVSKVIDIRYLIDF